MRWRLHAVLSAFALCALQILLIVDLGAMIVPMEGSASISIVLVTNDVVIAFKMVSGTTDEMFALDAKTQKVLWRAQQPRVQSDGLPGFSGAFLVFANEFAQKRDLLTGRILWQTRLDTIPEQHTRSEFRLKEAAQKFLEKVNLAAPAMSPIIVSGLKGGTPNAFHYKALRSGLDVVVVREAIMGGGCIVVPCFSDWLILDGKTGQQKAGGGGGLIASTDSVALFQQDQQAMLVRNGKWEYYDLPRGSSGFMPVSWHSFDRLAQRSRGERCVISAFVNGTNLIGVFSSAEDKLWMLNIQARPAVQDDWVLLENYLLRYSECARYNESKPSPNKPWVELYEFNGKLLKRSELAGAPDTDWFLHHRATIRNQVVFESGDLIIRVAAPELKADYWQPPKQLKFVRHETYTSRLILRDANQILEVDGSTYLRTMPAAEVPHELHLRAINMDTHQLAWKHVEPIVIRKIAR